MPQKERDFGERLMDALRAAGRFLRRVILQPHDSAPDGELLVPRDRPRPLVLTSVFTTLKILVVIVVLCGFVGLGLVCGIAKAYIDTSPELDISQLTKSDRTSYIYDCNGKLITTFAGLEYRDWVNYEDIPDMLINALVSVEDVRFFKHEGVDFKRLFSAVINTLRNTDTHGGSTLTQQLIKNKILTNEKSYKRKIQEAYLALQVEKMVSKKDILEAYLNDVYLGESNYGVKAASRDYFGKELNELSIRECAMLAGMVQKPYETNPRKNTYSRTYPEGHEKAGQNKMDVTDARTDVVINSMYDAGSITKEQRDAALADTVVILEKSSQSQIYDMPYFVEYGIRDVVTHLLDEWDMLDTTANRAAVENKLRTGGYHIYLTVDSDIQHTVQETLETWDDYPELANPAAATTTDSDGNVTVQPQAAAVIIDYSTGDLKAIVGGRESPVVKKSWNRAWQSYTPVGSAIKPLSVYGPALDMGTSPASIVLNLPMPIEGYGTEAGYPAIGSERWIGPVTIRRGITSSLNVVAARVVYQLVGLQQSKDYLVNLGADEARVNMDGPGLALGTSGFTPIQMAAAYATIANGGVYIEPMSFSRVVDDAGNVVLDAELLRDKHTVFKPSTCWLLLDMMEDVVSSGTGTSARLSGMTVAGKTGTNSDYSSAYFAGITPYYAGVVWVGHDEYAQKLASGSTGGAVAAPIWKSFMEKIHEGLADRPIMNVSTSELGLVKRTVCSVSGLLATEACYQDANHKPVTDWFEKNLAPQKECDMHVVVNICSASGELASVNCPASSVTSKCVILIHSESQYARIDQELLLKYLPDYLKTDIPAAEYGTMIVDSANLCHIHFGAGDTQESLIAEAGALIASVEHYLANVQSLPDAQRVTLRADIEALQAGAESWQFSTAAMRLAIDRLAYDYQVISLQYPLPGGSLDDPEATPSPEPGGDDGADTPDVPETPPTDQDSPPDGTDGTGDTDGTEDAGT